MAGFYDRYTPAIAILELKYASWVDATGVIPTMYDLSRSSMNGKNARTIYNKKKRKTDQLIKMYALIVVHN